MKDAIRWYAPSLCPMSPDGYVYIVRLLKPYLAGWRHIAIGSHRIIICWRCGKAKFVGGIRITHPQWVGRYIGWTLHSVELRFSQHRRGLGSRLLRHLASLDWPMEIEACTPGDRLLEARLKRAHNNQRVRLFPPLPLSEVA